MHSIVTAPNREAASADAAATAPAHGVPQGWPAALIWVVGATALQLFRQPGEPSWNSIWQEDGGIFLTDALDRPLASIFEPYNAYLHVVPRLLADFTALFPLERAALLLSGTAALVVALLSVYVYTASAAILRSTTLRAMLAALVVLVPASGYETNANIANLHWYLIFATFWVFVARPETRAGVALGSVIAAATVLSDPLVGLLLPLAAWYAWTRRDGLGLVVPIVFAVALAVQVVLGVVADPVEPYASSHVGDLPGIYALRVAGSVLVGDQFLDNLWKPYDYAFAVPALIIVGAICAYGLLRVGRRRRTLIAICLVLSIAFLVVPLMLRGTENFLDRADFNLNGSRYILLPVLFLITALLTVADGLGKGLRPQAWGTLQFGIAVFAASLVLTNYSIGAVRSAGPNWVASLDAARDRCRANGGLAPGERPPLRGPIPSIGREPGEARIPIAPNIPEEPFAAVIACDRLLGR